MKKNTRVILVGVLIVLACIVSMLLLTHLAGSVDFTNLHGALEMPIQIC